MGNWGAQVRIFVFVALLLALGSCASISQSRFNPFNWFGKGRAQAVSAEPAQPADPALADPRPLVADVIALTVERASGGAIITAVGTVPAQGFWNAELLALNGGAPVNGTLVYLFRVSPPEGQLFAVAARAWRITAAQFVSDNALIGVTSIVVRGARSERRSRR